MARSFDAGYLLLLSQSARYRGDHTKGEIEIVTDAETISEIIENRRRYLQARGRPDSGDELGI